MTKADVSIVAEHLATLDLGVRIDLRSLADELQVLKSSAKHYYRRTGDSLIVAGTERLGFSTKHGSTVVYAIDTDAEQWQRYRQWLEGRKIIRLAVYCPMQPVDAGMLEAEQFLPKGNVYYWRR